jgi:hypothetical protein
MKVESAEVTLSGAFAVGIFESRVMVIEPMGRR